MLRHLAQLSNGPEERRVLLSMILQTLEDRETDASSLQSLIQVSKAGNELMTDNFSQGLVLAFTKNNDPETLYKVLQIAQSKNLSLKFSEESERKHENPIIAASLENDIKCMRLLYKAGFRVRLAEKDWKSVKNLIKPPETRIRKKSQNLVKNLVKAPETKSETKTNPDPVKRFLLFKAYANPLYLSLELSEGKTSRESFLFRDPIKKAFALGNLATSLAEHFPEHSVEYVKIRKQLKTFAEELLGHCNNSDEVAILLTYVPQDGGGSEATREQDSLFITALSNEQKPFVAHPYYQQFLRTSLQDETGDSLTSGGLKKLWSFFTALLAFIFYPLVIVVDSLFREGTILFESPKEFSTRRKTDGNDCCWRRSVPEENDFWHFFRKKMHAPIYRIWIHFLSEVLFISIVYISLHVPRRQNQDQLIEDPELQNQIFVQGYNMSLKYKMESQNETDLGSGPTKSNQIKADFVMYVLVLHYLINDLVEIVRRTRVFFSSFWTKYTLAANIFLLSGGIITFCLHQYNDNNRPNNTNNRADLHGTDPLNLAVSLIALGAILYGLRTARWFLLHNKIGPVVICIVRVLKDVIYVFLIWIIVYMSFALGIWLVYKPFHDLGKCKTEYCLKEKLVHDNETMKAVLSQMFWLVFNGDGQTQRIQHKSALESTEEFSKEFAHIPGLSLWAMYQGVICILLINILIAMMNTTYNKVWENIDGEWKFSKSHFQV